MGDSLEESVFSIDHILENIFDFLETSQDLLKCRLVSHRWLSCAQNPLEKLVHVNFGDCLLINSKHSSSDSKSLSELTSFLQHSRTFTFPARKFRFIFSKKPGDELFQSFLPFYGAHITELTLIYDKFEGRPPEAVIQERVENILVHLAPNLHSFLISAPSQVFWNSEAEDESEFRNPFSALRQSDSEFHEIKSGCVSSRKNANLKYVRLMGHVSAKIFETIVQLSPNLEEVEPHVICHGLYLVEPVNRVHLIKDLCFNPIRLTIEKFERISLASFGQDGKTETRAGQLRHLHLYLIECINCNEWNLEVEKKTAMIMSRLLNGSWSTLETVTWSGLTHFHGDGHGPGILWPSLLPKVWKLKFKCPYYFHNSKQEARSSGFFPEGFSLAKTCPKLRFVCIKFSGKENLENNNNNSLIVNLFNSFNFEPVLSVKKVSIRKLPGSSPVLVGDNLGIIRTLFPNAEVSY